MRAPNHIPNHIPTERSTMPDLTPLLSADWIGATVSADTLRPDDLTRAAARVLMASGHPYHAEIAADLLAGLEDADRRGDAEGVILASDDAADILSGLAPVGAYYGAHPGDGALFGFWSYDEHDM